jgi:hypothetical protein
MNSFGSKTLWSLILGLFGSLCFKLDLEVILESLRGDSGVLLVGGNGESGSFGFKSSAPAVNIF